MSKFRDHLMVAIYGYQPPKFLTDMDKRAGGKPVKMPGLAQVMVAPLLILAYVGLYVTESYDVLLGITVLLVLGGVLLALVRNEADDRGGWDDVDLP